MTPTTKRPRGRPPKHDPDATSRDRKRARGVVTVELAAPLADALEASMVQHGDASRPAAIARLLRQEG